MKSGLLNLLATIAILASSPVIHGQDTESFLSAKHLPIQPLKTKQIVITDGMDFTLLPWDRINGFDPTKEMPTWSGTGGETEKVAWVPTPSDYVVTDDAILRVKGKRPDEFHFLRLIQYRERIERPSNFYTVLGLLCWDAIPFCAYCQDRQEENPPIHTDWTLDYDSSQLRIDLSQIMSGTGAYNTHALFTLDASKGPKLVKFTSGSRGR